MSKLILNHEEGTPGLRSVSFAYHRELTEVIQRQGSEADGNSIFKAIFRQAEKERGQDPSLVTYQ